MCLLWNTCVLLDCLLTGSLFPSHDVLAGNKVMEPLELGCGTVPGPRPMRLPRPWPTWQRCRNAFGSPGGKCWGKTLLLWAVQFISLQICNGWHLFAFLCGFGKEERIWIQNSYKMSWHGGAWIGLFCLLLLWITFHINFRPRVHVYLSLQSCTPLRVALLFEREIPHVSLLHIKTRVPRGGKSWSCGVKLGWFEGSSRGAGTLPALQSEV